jgi:hypothetical protein
LPCKPDLRADLADALLDHASRPSSAQNVTRRQRSG